MTCLYFVVSIVTLLILIALGFSSAYLIFFAILLAGGMIAAVLEGVLKK